MRRLLLSFIAVPCLVCFSAAGNVDGKISKQTGNAFSREHPAVVWLEGINAGAMSSEMPVMAQHGGQFVPPFLVVVSGQTVAMPNEDDVAHNVYSISAAKAFDLGFYAKGVRKTVTFDRLGLVEVGCVIHSFMRARILVVPNKYWAMVAADGTFHIRNVPPGTFSLKYWDDGGTSFTQLVTVPEGGKSVAVSLSPNTP
jgi:plastocyanin